MCGPHALIYFDPSLAYLLCVSPTPDPMLSGRRVSSRVQDQPDADDFQLGRAMRAAKLRDIESQTGMSVNKQCSILHFSEHGIISRAYDIGVSLGSNGKEIVKSVNDILDLEAERASKLICALVAVKPMSDADINNLGVSTLETFCDEMMSSSDAEGEAEAAANELSSDSLVG